MTTEQSKPESNAEALVDRSKYLPPRHEGLRLLRKLLIYHFVLAVAVLSLAMMFPNFLSVLPIGGVNELAGGGDFNAAEIHNYTPPPADAEIVETFIHTTGQLDRLGAARQLLMVLAGVWLLMLPVSWVHKGIHRVSTYDHSLDETTLILPGVVAAIVLVVQHSLALAFSLAGIVAGVHFRRALQDTFDALFILVAIGSGIAGGVKALEIAAVLTVFFCYATMFVYYLGDGLESHHLAYRKAIKQERKKIQATREQAERNEH